MFWVVEKEHIVDAERLALKSKKQHKAQESADKKADGACMKHWENKARQIPAAQELARCLGLKFPSSKKYVKYPFTKCIFHGVLLFIGLYYRLFHGYNTII